MRHSTLWARLAHLIRPARHRRRDAGHTLPLTVPAQRTTDSGRYVRVAPKRHAR